MTSLVLDRDLILRSPVMKDALGVAQLLNDCQNDLPGAKGYTPEVLLTTWQMPPYSHGQDAWVVYSKGKNTIVGYEEIRQRKIHLCYEGFGCVASAFRGKGIGTSLLRMLAARAQTHLAFAPAGERVYIQNWVSAKDYAAQRLHEQEGFVSLRKFWRMEIQMENAPLNSKRLAHIAFRQAKPGLDDRLTFEVLEEAFQDHWGDPPYDYEVWRRLRIEHADYDPSLWFIAMDAGEIAGVSICRMRDGIGWISQLAVRRTWRRQCLGKLLLLESLREFYRRGVQRVGLMVDSLNTTGATHLYKQAGMQIVHEILLYEKEIRPGV